MSKFYFRFWNEPRRLSDRPGIWRAKLGAAAPGNVTDTKNKQPGGYRRFERWHDRPLRAIKLYWRHHG